MPFQKTKMYQTTSSVASFKSQYYLRRMPAEEKKQEKAKQHLQPQQGSNGVVINKTACDRLGKPLTQCHFQTQHPWELGAGSERIFLVARKIPRHITHRRKKKHTHISDP